MVLSKVCSLGDAHDHPILLERCQPLSLSIFFGISPVDVPFVLQTDTLWWEDSHQCCVQDEASEETCIPLIFMIWSHTNEMAEGVILTENIVSSKVVFHTSAHDNSWINGGNHPRHSWDKANYPNKHATPVDTVSKPVCTFGRACIQLGELDTLLPDDEIVGYHDTN